MNDTDLLTSEKQHIPLFDSGLFRNVLRLLSLSPFHAGIVMVLIFLETVFAGISLALVLPATIALGQGEGPWRSLGVLGDFIESIVGTSEPVILLVLGCSIVAKSLIFILRNYATITLSNYLFITMGGRLFSQFIMLPYRDFREKRIGDTVSIIVADNKRSSEGVVFYMNWIARFFQFGGLIATMFLINHKIVFLGLGIALLFFVFSHYIIFPWSLKNGRLFSKRNGELFSSVNDFLLLFKEIKISNARRSFAECVRKHFLELGKVYVPFALFNQTATSVIELGFGTVLLIGSFIIYFHGLDMNVHLSSHIVFFGFGTYRLVNLGGLILKLRFILINRVASFERILHLFEEGVTEEEETEEEETEGKKLAIPHGDIVLENIGYAHDKKRLIFSNFSAIIPMGKMVCLVGKSGSGKSSLIDLIAGFIPVDSGSISFAGRKMNSADVSLENWREQFGYVGQDPFLLYGSVKENITFFSKKVSDANVKKAIMQVGLKEIIEALPKKYNSVIAERGQNFSGGQRRRIAIARELVKRPKVLILDETLESLPFADEVSIIAGLRMVKNLTVIWISHRRESEDLADHLIDLS